MSEDTMKAGDGIVVGVDGSETSKDALRWAAREAKRDGVALRPILCWHVPNTFYGGGVPLTIERNIVDDAKEALDKTVSEVLGDAEGIDLRAQVIEGHAGPELVEAAEGAGLLVVGSKGRGAFVGMLLGSISGYCVAHATCPVVVIPYHEE